MEQLFAIYWSTFHSSDVSQLYRKSSNYESLDTLWYMTDALCSNPDPSPIITSIHCVPPDKRAGRPFCSLTTILSKHSPNSGGPLHLSGSWQTLHAYTAEMIPTYEDITYGGRLGSSPPDNYQVHPVLRWYFLINVPQTGGSKSTAQMIMMVMMRSDSILKQLPQHFHYSELQHTLWNLFSSLKFDTCNSVRKVLAYLSTPTRCILCKSRCDRHEKRQVEPWTNFG